MLQYRSGSQRKENAMAKTTPKGKRLDYEVTVTAPRMRATVLEVKAPNSAIARREARKQIREERPSKKVSDMHFSAHRKER